MAWKTGPNAPLGVAQGNPAIVDSVPGGVGGGGGMPAGYVATPVGTIREFYEDTQGPAELIYLPGVAGLVAGDFVAYDLTPGAQAVVRHTSVTFKNSARPLAVAVGAPQAGQYGWFQIRGIALANVTGGAAGNPVYGTATAGSVSATALAGDQILNSRFATAAGTPSAGKAYIQVNDPCVQSQIT